MNTFFKNRVKTGINKLNSQLQEIAEQLGYENDFSNEEEFAIRQTLMDKKELIEAKISQLRDSLRNGMNNEEYILAVNGTQRKIMLVDPIFVNPAKGHISEDSPLGKSLRNAKEGDVVDMKNQNGNTQYLILKINGKH